MQRVGGALFTMLVLANPALPHTPLKRIMLDERQLSDGWTLTTTYWNTGKFSHCGVLATYKPTTAKNRALLRAEKMTLFLTADVNRYLIFALRADEWNITVDAEYRVDFVFNDEEQHWLLGKGTTSGSIQAGFDYDQKWVDLFTGKILMNLHINNKDIGTFKLVGAGNALRKLLVCVIDHSKSNQTMSTFGGSKDRLDGVSVIPGGTF